MSAICLAWVELESQTLLVGTCVVLDQFRERPEALLRILETQATLRIRWGGKKSENVTNTSYRRIFDAEVDKAAFMHISKNKRLLIGEIVANDKRSVICGLQPLIRLQT